MYYPGLQTRACTRTNSIVLPNSSSKKWFSKLELKLEQFYSNSSSSLSSEKLSRKKVFIKKKFKDLKMLERLNRVTWLIGDILFLSAWTRKLDIFTDMAVGAQNDLGGHQTFARKMTWCIEFLHEKSIGFSVEIEVFFQKKKKKKKKKKGLHWNWDGFSPLVCK